MSSSSDADRLAQVVATEFRRRLLGEHIPRLSHCIRLLREDQLWQRQGIHGNSIGNLLLHLRGNVTQWILATFGATGDARDRAAEFAASGGPSGAELLAALATTYTAACDTVDGLSVAELLRERTIQGRFRESGLSAVLHVLEHASGHAYQIYAATKLLTGEDLRFYDL